MVTETQASVDLSALSVKDLASIARRDIAVIGVTLPENVRNPDPIQRALSNVALVNQLRQLPSVEAFLRISGADIGVMVYNPMRSRKSFFVNSEGFKLVRKDNGNEQFRVQLDEAELRDMATRPSPYVMDYYFVDELSNLRPKKIVSRFKRALSTPIKIK